jgi:hypothetical protein
VWYKSFPVVAIPPVQQRFSGSDHIEIAAGGKSTNNAVRLLPNPELFALPLDHVRVS